MFNRSIFRTSSLERMNVPEDLDELMQVNSVKMWLLLAAMVFVIIGVVIWLFFSSITYQVKGFGILLTGETPREILASEPGQVDSLFCTAGDEVLAGQKLAKIRRLSGDGAEYLTSPSNGKVSVIYVNESGFTDAGHPVVEMVPFSAEIRKKPEVVFFIREQDVLKIKKGMKTGIQIKKEGVSETMPEGSVTYISEFSSPPAAIEKYFGNSRTETQPTGREIWYEVRAELQPSPKADDRSTGLSAGSLNGSRCEVSVVVARKSPASFLLNLSQ